MAKCSECPLISDVPIVVLGEHPRLTDGETLALSFPLVIRPHIPDFSLKVRPHQKQPRIRIEIDWTTP